MNALLTLVPMTVFVASPIRLIVALAVFGLIAWLLVTLIPMPSQVKTIIIVATCIICLLLLLDWLAIW